MRILLSEKYPEIKPTGESVGGRDTYILLKNVIVIIISDSNNCTYTINIPKGFVFDGASVPFGLWNIFPPLDSDYLIAALLHDFLYQSEYFDRKICDEVFYTALLTMKITHCKAYLMYLAVRLGGWQTWSTHNRSQVMRVRNLAGIYMDERPLILL